MSDPDPGENQNAEISTDNNKVNLGEFFSRRKPQNVLAGMSSGAKSAAKGALAGLVSLVAVPVVTIREEGASGIPKGILNGVVAGAGMTLGGVGIGLSQVIRGISNTPEAISELCKGKRRWDQDTRQWIQDDLEREKISMREFGNDEDIYSSAVKRADDEKNKSTSTTGSEDKKVADMSLYDQLGVPANATDSDIKKAYYRKASACHPDKNPSPDAKEIFQALSQAYQILSTPEKRKDYDNRGLEATSEQNDESAVGADVMFTALFGSDAFTPYIGKLRLCHMFMQDHVFSKDEQNELQRRREVRIAVHLSSLLRPYCDGHVDAWKESMQCTARELVKASFGERMLLEIGKAYQLEARRHKGILNSSMASFEGKADHIRAYGKIASHGYAALAYYKKAKNGEGDPTLASMGDSKSRDCLIEMALEGTILDISYALYGAADRLFHDNVETSVKNDRVEGLLLLGGIFIDIANQSTIRSTSQNFQNVLDQMPRIIAKKREERDHQTS